MPREGQFLSMLVLRIIMDLIWFQNILYTLYHQFLSQDMHIKMEDLQTSTCSRLFSPTKADVSFSHAIIT